MRSALKTSGPPPSAAVPFSACPRWDGATGGKVAKICYPNEIAAGGRQTPAVPAITRGSTDTARQLVQAPPRSALVQLPPRTCERADNNVWLELQCFDQIGNRWGCGRPKFHQCEGRIVAKIHVE